jgi:hypothetical protein
MPDHICGTQVNGPPYGHSRQAGWTAGDSGRDEGIARRDNADRAEYLLQRQVLDKEAAGSGPKRPVEVLVVIASTRADLRVPQVANQTWVIHAVLPDGLLS